MNHDVIAGLREMARDDYVTDFGHGLSRDERALLTAAIALIQAQRDALAVVEAARAVVETLQDYSATTPGTEEARLAARKVDESVPPLRAALAALAGAAPALAGKEAQIAVYTTQELDGERYAYSAIIDPDGQEIGAEEAAALLTQQAAGLAQIAALVRGWLLDDEQKQAVLASGDPATTPPDKAFDLARHDCGIAIQAIIGDDHGR